MEVSKVIPEQLDQLFRLISMYKSEIGEENILCNEDKEAITKAINENRIIFYFIKNESVIGMCSLTKCFSTYKAKDIAIMDDIFIIKEYIKKGYIRELVNNVYIETKEQNISSIILGASEINVDMYKSIGLNINLGIMLGKDLS